MTGIRAVFCTVAGIVLGAASEGPLWERHTLLAVVNLLASGAFTVSGLLMLGDEGQYGTAWALILGGITLPMGWSNQWGVGPFPLYSVVFGYLADIFGAWALLRYPEARLTPAHRRFCWALAGWLIVGPLLLTFISRPSWWSLHTHAPLLWPALWPDRPLYDAASYVFDGGALLLTLTFVLLLVRRVLTASRRDRVILLPVITVGVLAAVAAGVALTATAVSGPNDELFAIEGVIWLTVPVGCLVSVIQQRLVRMAHLVTQLNLTAPTADLLRQVLRVNLRDPQLELVTWSAADLEYHTVDGHKADLDVLGAGRKSRDVTGRDSERLAILLIDPSSARDESLLATAAAVTRLTLENAQLSRRLLTAEYGARQQIVADLHDGVQSKLCGLLVALSAARRSADQGTQDSIDRMDELVRDALSDLRGITHDVYPQALARLGLRAAIEDAARYLNLPAEISAPSEGLPAGTEKPLYFMICEALTNIHRHAKATAVTVSVSCDGQLVKAIVTDNGVGGIDPLGSGLSKMRDRARAHGGELGIQTPAGGGTTLTMRIPCA